MVSNASCCDKQTPKSQRLKHNKSYFSLIQKPIWVFWAVDHLPCGHLKTSVPVSLLVHPPLSPRVGSIQLEDGERPGGEMWHISARLSGKYTLCVQEEKKIGAGFCYS